MVLLFVVCGWREETMAGVCQCMYLVHSTYVFFCTRGYKRRKNRKPSCTLRPFFHHEVQTPLISSNGFDCLILVICVRMFGVETLEKLMFSNGVVCFRFLLVVPVYFLKLFQSPFLSFFSSLRKNYLSCCIHVNTTKLNVLLFF